MGVRTTKQPSTLSPAPAPLSAIEVAVLLDGLAEWLQAHPVSGNAAEDSARIKQFVQMDPAAFTAWVCDQWRQHEGYLRAEAAARGLFPRHATEGGYAYFAERVAQRARRQDGAATGAKG